MRTSFRSFWGKDDGTLPDSYGASTKTTAIHLVREHGRGYSTGCSEPSRVGWSVASAWALAAPIAAH
jgi:hypothetical protein